MIVVDASVLANAIRDDGPDGDTARRALRGEDVAAPTLVDVEVFAVLRTRWLAGDLSDERLQLAVEDLLELGIGRHPMLPTVWRAFELGVAREQVVEHCATPVDV